MPSPSALAARRRLAERIDRFLKDEIAHPTPHLTGWQADLVLAAMTALNDGYFANGEHAMMKVEKANVFEPPDYVPAVLHDARRQLIERLERVWTR